MIELFSRIARDECGLVKGHSLVVGVSGGPDSLCLMDLFHCLGYVMVVVHFNHRLRPEADQEVDVVRQMAEERGLAFVAGSEDVADYAHFNALSVEEAARLLRYRFLFSQAEAYKAQAVAVAHTADDQVETVLMHLLRGAGLSGLKGMLAHALPNPWSEKIPLVRPLLAFWREEVLAYLQENGLTPLMDPTNQVPDFYRNHLRLEVVPYLESVKPGFRQALIRMAAVLSAEDEILRRLQAEAWEDCVISLGEGYVGYHLSALTSQPLGIQRRLMREGIARLRPGLRNIDYEDVKRALEFAITPTRNKQRDLSAGLRLSLEGETLWLSAWEADLPMGDWPHAEGKITELDVPGQVHLSSGWVIQTEITDLSHEFMQECLQNADPYQAWMDAEKLRLPLKVRRRKPGDRFQPIGLGGQMVKVSDYMINVKMPRRRRAGWPLVCSSEEITWIPGYRLDERFRLTSSTLQAIHITLAKG